MEKPGQGHQKGHLAQQRDADAGNSPVDSLKVYGEHNDKGRGKKADGDNAKGGAPDIQNLFFRGEDRQQLPWHSHKNGTA